MSTYTPIASQTLGSAAASVTFSSIPQGYTDLVIVVNAICASGDPNVIKLQYNNDTSSGLYSSTRLVGNGSTVNTDRQTSANFIYAGLISPTVRNSDIYQIQNYSNVTTFKTCVARASLADNQTRISVGLWRNTNAITSLTLSHEQSTNFNSGSTFTLYGIQVGDKAQKAQGGNIVTSDGTYVYHTFTSSGSFIPSQALTVDYLVVAGGGSGGGTADGGVGSGGGGAGGLRSTVTATGGGGSLESALSLTANTAYTVLVGAGGASASALSFTQGNNGSNSVFSSITSTGGGGGGSQSGTKAGNSGGSGGGGGVVEGAGGSGTANEGYAGGSGGFDDSTYGTGGGGGAGAVGGSVTTGSRASKTGGAGVAVAISGSSVTYAGGGGGGGYAGGSGGAAGGSGGGGAGGNGNANGTNGSTNTGGGGGGGGNAAASGAGGSGIVIIRYLA